VGSATVVGKVWQWQREPSVAPWAGTEGSGSEEGRRRECIMFECGERPLRRRKKYRN